MGGVETIQTALRSTERLLLWHLSDLDDQDLLVRPVPKANHLAWQLGHLITTEKFHIHQQLPEFKLPELPMEFASIHGSESAQRSDSGGFSSLAEYQRLFADMRAATIEAVSRLSDADLDRPAVGAVAGFAPTLGEVMLLVSNHTLLHCGQVTVIRRLLGKPVLF